MGTQFHKSRHILLYGVEDSGKTLLQYYIQSTLKDFKEIMPTEGYNYEEITLDNTQLGIFDVSGDPNQYEIVNIILKCVNIVGIIFVVPLKYLSDLKKSKSLLKKVLANKNLKDDISLLVVYNYYDIETKENLNWMTNDMLDARMKLKEIAEKFNIPSYKSSIVDIKNLNIEKFDESLRQFIKK